MGREKRNMTVYAQLFCTVDDIRADAQSAGVDEARVYQAIREACDYLQKEIGWFIPVTQTVNFSGKSKRTLFVPPLLGITSISNDDTALTAADYILKPDGGMWANGPYTRLIADPDSTLLTVWTCEIDDVVIAGRWGLYERTAALASTVADTTQQSDSQLTLKVSSGAEVSPGMVLLIGSEQELVTGWSTPTASATTLNGAVAATDEYITVANASLVNIGEIVRVEFEQMLVRDLNTTNQRLSVIRGWNGTARVLHTTSTAVDVYRTVTVTRAVNGTTAAAHANGAAISRYFAPDDIQYLAKQIATLIINKAKSGYQGRTGNAELGVVFYNDAFPRQDIERIKARYNIRSFA
jgi:hypothetical protein